MISFVKGWLDKLILLHEASKPAKSERERLNDHGDMLVVRIPAPSVMGAGSSWLHKNIHFFKIGRQFPGANNTVSIEPVDCANSE